jgi:hypothetical protein
MERTRPAFGRSTTPENYAAQLQNSSCSETVRGVSASYQSCCFIIQQTNQESDLLLRVRQDIELMHRDLAERITVVHHDIRRLMGVLIPDLDEALDQRTQRSVVLLEVPIDLDDQFRFAALTGHPRYRVEDDFELGELSDAFILNFHRSTINFQSGILVEDRVPAVDQYLNLLKCVWIFKRMQASPTLKAANKDTSHWPSYTRQLEDVRAWLHINT